MALLTMIGRHFLSASGLQIWQKQLMEYFAWAAAGGGCFNDNRDTGAATTWSGYILYTGATDTLRYQFYTGGDSTTLRVNGSPKGSWGAAGTKSSAVSLADLSLTAGQVYTVEIVSNAGGLSVTWLGLEYTPGYTGIGTFASLGTTYDDDEVEVIKTGIEEVGELVTMPVAPTVVDSWGEEVNDANESFVVWKGTVKLTGDYLRWRFQGRADSGYGVIKLFLNGALIDERDLYDLPEDPIEVYDIDISGAGLTIGSLYAVQVEVHRDGTGSDVNASATLWELTQYSSHTQSTDYTFAPGEAVEAAGLNWFKTVIDRIHPAASSPDTPLYFAQPAVRVSPETEYYLTHRRRFLRYWPDGTNTPEITLMDGSKVSLGASDYSYDLTQTGTLALGANYMVDDSDFAQEYSDDA